MINCGNLREDDYCIATFLPCPHIDEDITIPLGEFCEFADEEMNKELEAMEAQEPSKGTPQGEEVQESYLDKELDMYFTIYQKVKEKATEFGVIDELSTEDKRQITTHLSMQAHHDGFELQPPVEEGGPVQEKKTAGNEPKGKIMSEKQLYAITKNLDKHSKLIGQFLDKKNRRIATDDEAKAGVENKETTEKMGRHVARSWEISELIESIFKLNKGEK